MYRIFVLIVMFSFSVTVSAQNQADAGKPPASTKLEAFSSRTGVVIVRGYSEVGTVSGMGSVSIQAREFREASNPRAALYGVVITVTESGRLARDSISYVDEDEIDALIKGLEYIKQIDRTVTSLGGFEAEFRTKGDLSMIVYSGTASADGVAPIDFAVSSGRIGKTTAFLKLTDAEKIRSLLMDAKVAIANAKKPAA